MVDFSRPRVVVSKCLEFEACRYNGDVIRDETVQRLVPFVEFVPVCPEVEIGLGTPRETIRIVSGSDGKKMLVQPREAVDLSGKMLAFADQFLGTVGEVDGFILKSRSPSCGVKDVKVYSGIEKAPVKEKGSGFFGAKVLEKFPGAAIEEEGRLRNFTLRHTFLTRLFVLAEFRSIRNRGKLEELAEFHSRHKYLFMAYSQPKFKKLSKIAAAGDHTDPHVSYSLYEELLIPMFRRTARYDSNINVCRQMMESFEGQLSKGEKQHLLELLGKYKEKKVPLASILSVLTSWSIRFEDEHLLKQSYFEPYPGELMEITDSGKGRDYS